MLTFPCVGDIVGRFMTGETNRTGGLDPATLALAAEGDIVWFGGDEFGAWEEVGLG